MIRSFRSVVAIVLLGNAGCFGPGEEFSGKRAPRFELPSSGFAAPRVSRLQRRRPEADVLIHPNLGYYAGRDEAYRRRVIAIAYRAARERLPAVLAAIARSTETLAPRPASPR